MPAMLDLVWVAVSAAAWCLLHSWFIARRAQARLARALGRRHAYSRLFYVLASTLSLLGLMLWWQSLPTLTWFAWPGFWGIARWTGLVAAGALFVAGSRVHDNAAFLGLRQIADMRAGRPAPRPRLSRRGILNRTRHPYYAGSFLFFLFCLPVTDVNLVWRLVFLVYTYVGTVLEERKLRAEYGDEYVRYAAEVPRFWPRIGTGTSPRP
jgi:protein-S-isoprenylcysteine O-methyltransferase Ste14